MLHSEIYSGSGVGGSGKVNEEARRKPRFLAFVPDIFKHKMCVIRPLKQTHGGLNMSQIILKHKACVKKQ